MQSSSPPSRWPVIAGGLAVACGLGFGVARLTDRPAPPPAAPAAPAAEAKTATALTIPAAHLATMQIAVEPAALGSFETDIQATATAASAPNGEAVVSAPAAGTVTRLNARLGDAVKAGQVLVHVASRDAAAMAADRATAQSRAALARSSLAREQSLYDQRVTPRQDLEAAQAAVAAAEAEARRAGAAAATARVSADGDSVAAVSPIGGRVTAQSVALGAFVQPGTELFRIADPRFVQVEAAVPAADAQRIRPGDPARITTGAGVMTAVVRSVTPSLDAQTRAATVILALTGGPGAVTPGEAVQAQISPKAGGPQAVVIPDEAVQTVDGREVVFVRTAAGFKVQPVTVGRRGGGRAAIVSGLAAGQPIATRNAFLLKAELTKGAEDEE